MARARFYESGLRFHCRGTGGCCHGGGGYGYVYLSLEDRQRLARHLGLAAPVFTRRYCVHDGDDVHLAHPERDCQFLDGVRCRVYAARPLQCRTWPFWPENLSSPEAWKEAAARCPGIGQGRLYDAEEIAAILEQQKE